MFITASVKCDKLGKWGYQAKKNFNDRFSCFNILKCDKQTTSLTIYHTLHSMSCHHNLRRQCSIRQHHRSVWY